jgi:acyl carrier protein
MAGAIFETMGTKEVTQSEIRDWLIEKIADTVKCPPADIGVEESFTSLGLDSLSMLTLTGDLAAWLGRDLPATLLLRHAAIGDLVDHLTEMSPDEMAPPPSREPGIPIPVTFAQERLLKHAVLPPGRDTNLLSPRFILRGSFDVAAMKRALDEMVRRHEILRTTFHQQNGDFVQVVHPPEPVVMEVVDWSADKETQSDEELAVRARAHLMQPVDLSSPPLFRAMVVRLAEDDHRLLFLFHHLLTDADAMRVFYGDVSRMYAAYHKNFQPALDPLDWQYADFALWERNWLRKDGSPYQDRLKWWREYWRTLPQRPEFTLAWKTPPEEPPSPHACILWAAIDEDTRSRTEVLARQCQATIYTVLFSAFGRHLLRYIDRSEVVVGTYVSDRKRVAAGQLMGMFVSMVPVRVSIPPGMTFREQVRQAQEHLDLVSLHRELPFEHLVEHLAAEGSAAPEVQVMFQQIETISDKLPLDDLQTSTWKTRVPRNKNAAFSFFFVKAPAESSACVSFDETQYDPSAIEAFLTSFVQELQKLVSAPDEVREFQPAVSGKEDWQDLFGPG